MDEMKYRNSGTGVDDVRQGGKSEKSADLLESSKYHTLVSAGEFCSLSVHGFPMI